MIDQDGSCAEMNNLDLELITNEFGSILNINGISVLDAGLTVSSAKSSIF